MSRYFSISPEALHGLAQKDARLSWVMTRMDPPRREVMPDLFMALLYAITGQQVSGRAQATVWARLCAGLEEVTPQCVHMASMEKLRAFGLSLRKASYMKEAAARIVRGELEMVALPLLSDAAFCTALMALPGVGRWTAEMLLIFCLQRPDVFSYGDLGIHRGLRMLYGYQQIDRACFEICRQRYSPYATLASFYLWAVAGGALSELQDPSI